MVEAANIEPGGVLTRIELIQLLQAKVPLNVYGIPEGIYRPDLLPETYTLESVEIDQPVPMLENGGCDDPSSVTDESLPDVDTNHTIEPNGESPPQKGADWVGSTEGSSPDSGELQPTTDNQEAKAPPGSHPRVLELEGILDPRQAILERLPEPTSLAEPKAELDGSDVITAFASSFASRENPSVDITNGADDVPPVDLPVDEVVVGAPEDSELFGHGSNGSSGAVDPLAVSDQLFQRVGVDLMQFRHAFLPIVFAEGFPAYPDGRPVWLRMDCEPEDVHRLFEQYLVMGQAGVRQLFLLENLGPQKLHELREFFYLYNWAVRSTAYDIFRVAEFRKIQSNRALEMEDDHFIKAQRLFDKAMMYMESQEFLDQLTPKSAIDLMKTVVAIQRMSVGMSPTGGKTKETNETPATSLEVTMRGVRPPSEAANESVGMDSDGNLIHGQILESPETTHLMQELIIKLNPKV